MPAVLSSSTTDPRWYALAVHARQEKAAQEGIAPRVAEVFLPTRVERRAWSDRIKAVELALFPGYLFVRTAMSAEARVSLLKCRQVVDLVGRLPGDPAIARAIPDAEIESLKLVVASERAVDPVERLVRGTRVLVVQGPLRGASGVVEQGADGHRRLVCQIALLGRGVRTVLSADDVLEDKGDPGGLRRAG